MKLISSLILSSFISCSPPKKVNTDTNGEVKSSYSIISNEAKNQRTKISNERFEHSFSTFSKFFKNVELPYSQESNALWDGDLFYNENLQGYDYESSYLSYELLEKWVVPFENELSKQVRNAKEGLKSREDRWFSIHAGISFNENSQNHYLVHFYEKTSEVNGAYWYSYLLSYNHKNEQTACINLGREGLYTFTVSRNTDALTFWQRQTDIEALSFQISPGVNIQSCRNSRTEIEGDLSPEQVMQINNVNVIQDSLIDWVKFHKEECKNFKN